jgi:reverse gyrase
MDTIENFFGIIRYDGTLKPVYNTIKNILQSGQ